jgi:hypothetical protein
LDVGRFFNFLILYIVGRTPWTGDQSVSRPVPIHRTTQTQNKCTQTSMPRMGFVPTIPAFGWARRVHVADRAATPIGGATNLSPQKISLLRYVTKCLGPGRILWIHDLTSGKYTSDTVRGMLEVCIGQVRS